MAGVLSHTKRERGFEVGVTYPNLPEMSVTERPMPVYHGPRLNPDRVHPFFPGTVHYTPAPRFLDAGQYDDEDAWNPETDKFDPRKIRIRCPNCKREFAALCSGHTTLIDSGWRWVGMDHREPYADYKTKCTCGWDLRFTTYTPQ